MIVIPAIDLLGARVVRLRQGDYARATHYDADAVALAVCAASAGAQALHVVDLDAARSGTATNHDTVAAITRAVPIPVQVGGGIRRRADAVRLFDAGVARAVVGSTAVRDPDAVLDWIARDGVERYVVALDVRRDPDGAWRPATDGWTRAAVTTLDALLERYAANAPDLRVLCTDIDRDGMRSGPNLALYAALRDGQPTLRIVASGGVRDARDLASLAALGLYGAVTGRAALDSPESLPELLAC